ncbi:hypothetical protein [Paraburkholderia sp. RL17-381-BIF-C]|uniref:hypothetical protein n=1 Tax=Paraburkholderia sp. RL17-381-BIF-C TaxID=3031635 RepID=UPI0038BB5321
MHNNVVALRDLRRVSCREGRHFDILNPVGTAAVLSFRGRIDDNAVLVRVAPWLRREEDIVDEWRRCLFVSRFSRDVDAATNSSTVANVRWRVERRSEVKGRIATEAGNVTATLAVGMAGGYAVFDGHRDALVLTGIARPQWLHTDSRGGRIGEFEACIFGAERKIIIRRSRDRYSVHVKLATGEIPSPREALQEAKSAVEREINSLPASQSDYQRWFSQLAAMAVGMVEQVAYDSKGGFSLDAESRAAILRKALDLRQTIQRTTIKFDRTARSDEIERVVKKHSTSDEARL